MYTFNKEEVLKDWEMTLVWDTAFEDGKIEGEMIGIEKGQLGKALQIAKGMLAEKLPLELIVKLTGLSLSEIEKLANPFLNDEEK
jgi:predicted transposase YdaD